MLQAHKESPRQSPRFSFCLFPPLDLPRPPLRAKRGLGVTLRSKVMSEQSERVVGFNV